LLIAHPLEFLSWSRKFVGKCRLRFEDELVTQCNVIADKGKDWVLVARVAEGFEETATPLRTNGGAQSGQGFVAPAAGKP
jgi:hypothetical protein